MRWIVFILFFTLQASAALQYLTKLIVPETSFETPSTNWNAGDDDTIRVDLGFNFPFNSTTYNQVWIDSNGRLSFSSINSDYSNEQLPKNDASQSIYPYWDDINPPQGGTIKYETLGNASNRHFVVSWNNTKHYSNYGNYTFQVVLYEDGAIRFRYQAGSSADGTNCEGHAGCIEAGTPQAGATIGVQEDTSHYDQHSYDAQIDQTKDVLYIPNPINITASPSSCTKIQKIAFSTYDTTGYNSYPNNASEYQTLISNYATSSNLFGSGYIDNINVSSVRNNNPYQSNPDEHYLALFKGYIYLPDTGIYKFGIDGDDAVEVYIDGTLITGWYGGHARANHSTHIKYVNATAGYHKIEYHMQERTGGDSYYLYWQPPSGSSIVIVPASRFYHCGPVITKTSCIINDPVNASNNPKRIPGGTIRYAVEVDNTHFDAAKMDSVLATDTLDSHFDAATIQNLVIGSGVCNCLNPGGTSANGTNGGTSGSTVTLDFGTVNMQTKECGYFEVKIK